MRKRNNSYLFRLTKKEAQDFNKKVKKSGLSRESFIRAMIAGYQLHEKPDEEFYQVMRQMSALGNSMNQIAKKTNALGFVDAPAYEREVQKLHKLQLEIKKKFLVPDLE